MWIIDIKKAMFMLENNNSLLIEKIENGMIYFTNHTKRSIAELVAEYDAIFYRKDEE